MFLLKACSSSHSRCLGLAGLTNARLVLSPERALSLGVSGTRTHTVPSSRFSFTFNTTRERQREGQRREKWCAKKERKKKEDKADKKKSKQIRMQRQTIKEDDGKEKQGRRKDTSSCCSLPYQVRAARSGLI